MNNLRIYKSNRLENFLPAVCPIIERLAGNDPMKKKSIIVQSDGMARWLTVKAARKEGVFANFEFVSPDGFLRSFAEKYFGMTHDSVYNKKNAEWALYSLLRREKNSLAASYIGGDDARAFRLGRTLADMIEQYFVYRPNMMADWQRGKLSTDDPDESWQFDIFCKLAEKTDTLGFARFFNEKCGNAPDNAAYPKELILFGISIMNRYQLNMFLNLSRLFPIHLFAMTPSSEYFDSVSKKKGAFDTSAEDSMISAAGIPDTFFRRFCAAGLDFADFAAENLPDEVDLFEKPDGKTLLASIQRDILNDTDRPEEISEDDSVRILSCRDKMREIEVVKDTLLELFNADETLKPEDVAVMAPKINDYAPYISAVFGGTDPQDGTFIPWVISDRSFSSESRIAATFLEILRLAGSDFEKSRVLSIFRSSLVREKFNVDERAVGEIEKIVGESAVRWGLDAGSRGGNIQNTWEFGLSRIMMSFLMPFSESGECFENILPMKHFSKEDAENISSFITFAKELFRYSEQLASSEKTPAEFRDMLEKMLDFFFLFDKNDRNVREEVSRIRSVIDDFAETAEKYAETLSFNAVLQYLEDELGREFPGRGFLSANVNFCSLKPLRALPFRVIYLIGMGDDDFPRSENRYAFDLSQKKRKKENGAPQPRSVRDNDKYLFAEAVVSALEKLIISYEAGDLSEDSKKHRSAAVPVQILEKYIERKTGVQAGKLETKYPVQPFSEEYFKDGGFKTFSKRDFEIAKAMFHVEQNVRGPVPKKTSDDSAASCGDTVTEVVDLEKLISFLKDPLKFHLKKNIRTVFPDDSEDKGDEELFDYSGDNILAYNIRKTYIDMARNMPEEFFGDPVGFEKIFVDRIKREGNIPFGSFGEAVLKELLQAPSDKGLSLRAIAGNIAGKDLESQYISVGFSDLCLELNGTVKNIERNAENGDRMILATPSSLKEKYMIEVLIMHLAANAAGISVDTYFFCRGGGLVLNRLVQKDAGRYLSRFMELWSYAKVGMPLFDPELIGKIGKLLKDTGEDGPDDETVLEAVRSFFENKWKCRNDEYSFLSAEFLAVTVEFIQREDDFLKEFPCESVLEAAKIFKEFYLDKKDGRKKK